MADYNTTADALDRMAMQQQALVDASAAFRKLGSVEQAIREVEARKKRADDEATSANDELVAIKRKITDATKLQQTKMQQAVEELNKLHIDDQAKAEALIGDAKVLAANILQEANDKASAWADGVRAQLNNTITRQKKLDADCTELEAKRASIMIDIQSAQSALDGIRDTLSKLAGVA